MSCSHCNTWLDHTMYPLLSTRLQVMWWPQETTFSLLMLSIHQYTTTVIWQWKPKIFSKTDGEISRPLRLFHRLKCSHQLSIDYQGSQNLWPIPLEIMAHTGLQQKKKKKNPNTMKCAMRVKLRKTKAGWEQPSHEMSGIKMRRTKAEFLEMLMSASYKCENLGKQQKWLVILQFHSGFHISWTWCRPPSYFWDEITAFPLFAVNLCLGLNPPTHHKKKRRHEESYDKIIAGMN